MCNFIMYNYMSINQWVYIKLPNPFVLYIYNRFTFYLSIWCKENIVMSLAIYCYSGALSSTSCSCPSLPFLLFPNKVSFFFTYCHVPFSAVFSYFFLTTLLLSTTLLACPRPHVFFKNLLT